MSSSIPSPARSIYGVFRRRCHYSARNLTLVLIIIFISLNLIVYTKFSSLFSLIIGPELPVDRREANTMTHPADHPFPPVPEWMADWLHSRRVDPALNESEGQSLAIDIVYTWVNGSDPKLREIKERYQNASPLFQEHRTGSDQTANRFRDMDELRYSMRSVAQYATKMFKRIHILTTEVNPETDEGQVPSWLDLSTSKEVVQLVHHDVIFDDQTVLPSFNSLSIESQIHHIPNLTDVFLYLNDDVFLGTSTTPADVWTPLYGFVFHMEPTLLVPPTILDTREGTIAIGEWNSLQYSNFLLSKQFGPRYRSYLAHVPHVLSAPMLKEIQTIWPEDFKKTSSHRFRGEGLARDVQVSFFMAHYVVERLRETELSSFWFNRLDANQDGILDWSEREQLIKRANNWNRVQQENTGVNPPTPYFGNFSSFTQNSRDLLRQLGYNPTGSSVYTLSGFDGYPFMLNSANTSSTVLNSDHSPYQPDDNVELRRCHLDIDFCFGSPFSDSSVPEVDMMTSNRIFQRVAFSEFHCGDCLLHILRQTATEPGLGSEILPLDKESQAYKNVNAELSKYNYVISSSSYSFVQLQEAWSSQKNLNQLLAKKATEAFFCINDNVSDNPRIESTVRTIFRQFLDERFPISSPWEKS